MLGLAPDWVAVGLCVVATGASPIIGLALGLSVVMPAVVLGGLLWGSIALGIVVSVALPVHDANTLVDTHHIELIGQFALVTCLSVVAVTIYEHQQGVIQRVSRAPTRGQRNHSCHPPQPLRCPNVFAAIRTSRPDDSLTTDARELTVFFADIEGFTELTERHPAGVVTRLLNDYLDTVNAMANKHASIVDKFMGGGVLAFFDDSHGRGTATVAVACAHMTLEMRDELALLREVWPAGGMGVDLHVRMGIHTGLCRIGNFGSAARMDYAMIGTPVNLSSRLEDAARSDQILVSDTTHCLIADSVSSSPLETLQLKGISTPVQVHALLRQSANDAIPEAATASHASGQVGGARQVQDTLVPIEAARATQPGPPARPLPPARPGVTAIRAR